MKTMTLTTKETMLRHIKDVWLLLAEAYSKVEGGLHYASPAHLLNETCRWRVVVHYGKVIAVTIFRAKKGWKLVAMARCFQSGSRARYALCRLIKADLPRSWMELSGKAESFVFTQCGGQSFIIHGSLAHDLLDKIIYPSALDSFHYRREIAGIVKDKILVGTPLMA